MGSWGRPGSCAGRVERPTKRPPKKLPDPSDAECISQHSLAGLHRMTVRLPTGVSIVIVELESGDWDADWVDSAGLWGRVRLGRWRDLPTWVRRQFGHR